MCFWPCCHTHYTVRVYESDGTTRWKKDYFRGVADTTGLFVNDICTDGTNVYVVGDRVTDGTDYWNMVAYDAATGSVAWKIDIYDPDVPIGDLQFATNGNTTFMQMRSQSAPLFSDATEIDVFMEKTTNPFGTYVNPGRVIATIGTDGTFVGYREFLYPDTTPTTAFLTTDTGDSAYLVGTIGDLSYIDSGGTHQNQSSVFSGSFIFGTSWVLNSKWGLDGIAVSSHYTNSNLYPSNTLLSWDGSSWTAEGFAFGVPTTALATTYTKPYVMAEPVGCDRDADGNTYFTWSARKTRKIGGNIQGTTGSDTTGSIAKYDPDGYCLWLVDSNPGWSIGSKGMTMVSDSLSLVHGVNAGGDATVVWRDVSDGSVLFGHNHGSLVRCCALADGAVAMICLRWDSRDDVDFTL